MRYPKALVKAIFVFLLPCFVLFPHTHIFALTSQIQENLNEPLLSLSHENDWFFSYDQILKLIDDLDNGKLEKSYSVEELEQINHFFIHLAKHGIVSDDEYEQSILENDVEELLDPYDLGYHFDYKNSYEIIPAIFDNQQEFILCKSWASKKWKKTKKFVKDHKKEILIGGAVVVAASAIIICATATAPVAGVAALAGAATSSDNYKKDYSDNTNGTLANSQILFDAEHSSTLTTLPSDATPNLKGIFQDHFDSFKEQVIEQNTYVTSDLVRTKNELTFREQIRGFGSYLAHETFDEIAELASVVPQLNEEIKQIGNKFIPNSFKSDISTFPKENYEKIVTAGHNNIDKIFSTHQSERYTPEAKANDPRNNFTVGMIPPPGAILHSEINFKSLLDAGKSLDRGGFTKAGRSLMKHGNRQGSVFPKPKGNPIQINDHAQKILESILQHPEKIIIERPHPDFGKIIEIKVPKMGGVRFTIDGEMIGFIEP
jgi:hypothetical protein